jgi:hypothetical protein
MDEIWSSQEGLEEDSDRRQTVRQAHTQAEESEEQAGLVHYT